MNQIVNEMELEHECVDCENINEFELPVIELEIALEECGKEKKGQKKLSKELLKIMKKGKKNNNFFRELKSADIESSKVFYRHSWNY
jgi:hypothetical protein